MRKIKTYVKNLMLHALRDKGFVCEWTPAAGRDPKHRLGFETEFMVAYLAYRRPRAQFVVIGANDGRLLDPVYPFSQKHDWAGVLLEPHPATYAALVANHPDGERFRCLQAAIDHKSGARTLYHFDVDGLADRTSLIASFDRGHIEKHQKWLTHKMRTKGLPANESSHRIMATEVPCLTYGEVLAKLPRPEEPLDLVVIDVEGFDAEVVSMLDLKGDKRPLMVVYEKKHCAPVDQERAALILTRAGYRIAFNEYDGIAVDVERLPMLVSSEEE
mgnify:CR=1 FL=1